MARLRQYLENCDPRDLARVAHIARQSYSYADQYRERVLVKVDEIERLLEEQGMAISINKKEDSSTLLQYLRRNKPFGQEEIVGAIKFLAGRLRE